MRSLLMIAAACFFFYAAEHQAEAKDFIDAVVSSAVALVRRG